MASRQTAEALESERLFASHAVSDVSLSDLIVLVALARRITMARTGERNIRHNLISVVLGKL